LALASRHVSTPRIALIGAGAFGRNHLRVIHQSEHAQLAGVLDLDPQRAAEASSTYACPRFLSLEELAANADGAVIASPTVTHADLGCRLMEAGLDVLVEKPIAPDPVSGRALVETAARRGRTLQVGHLERFNPAVRATIPLLTQPMFFEVHRLSVFTPRALDVDVVLDLMIHDLDIVLSFVKSPVKEVRAVGLAILSGKTDIANVRVEFASGCVANFTASRVSTERIRKLRFFQPRQYISVDYGRQDVLAFTVGDDPGAGAIPSVNPQIGMVKPPVTSEEPLHAELKSFLAAVRDRSVPVVPLEDGRLALALALEIVDHIHRHGDKINLEKLAGRER